MTEILVFPVHKSEDFKKHPRSHLGGYDCLPAHLSDPNCTCPFHLSPTPIAHRPHTNLNLGVDATHALRAAQQQTAAWTARETRDGAGQRLREALGERVADKAESG
jgi:hypothetical protein